MVFYPRSSPLVCKSCSSCGRRVQQSSRQGLPATAGPGGAAASAGPILVHAPALWIDSPPIYNTGQRIMIDVLPVDRSARCLEVTY